MNATAKLKAGLDFVFVTACGVRLRTTAYRGDYPAALADALASVAVQIDALGRESIDGVSWLFKSARLRTGPRRDVVLKLEDRNGDAGDACEVVPPVPMVVASYAVDPRIEKLLKPARCSVGGCSEEWSGARVDPRTGSFRWLCRFHAVADWPDIHDADDAAAAIAAEPDADDVDAEFLFDVSQGGQSA